MEAETLYRTANGRAGLVAGHSKFIPEGLMGNTASLASLGGCSAVNRRRMQRGCERKPTDEHTLSQAGSYGLVSRGLRKRTTRRPCGHFRLSVQR